MRAKQILITVAVAFCCVMAAAAAPGTITGQVLDSEGAVLPAHVLFHPDFAGEGQPKPR